MKKLSKEAKKLDEQAMAFAKHFRENYPDLALVGAMHNYNGLTIQIGITPNSKFIESQKPSEFIRRQVCFYHALLESAAILKEQIAGYIGDQTDVDKLFAQIKENTERQTLVNKKLGM